MPWLWAIENAGKAIENRTWSPPADAIGERIALHAAKSWDPKGLDYFVELGIDHPRCRALYTTSAITSVATIERVIGPEDPDRMIPHGQDRWFFGPYGWVLVDVRRLATPIPWRGAQGLRHLPAETTAEINRQIGEQT